jgi:hypothetical protein
VFSIRRFLTFLTAVTLTVSFGCASRQQPTTVSLTTAPGVSLPAVTEFDDDQEARAAYLRGFRSGYLQALQGHHGVPDTFGRGGRKGVAWEIGWMDGQAAADKARTDQERRRLQKQIDALKAEENQKDKSR